MSLSLENRIQDCEHKFRMVLLGTGKVSEITHFSMDSPIRKTLKKMSLNVKAEPIKLYKKQELGEPRIFFFETLRKFVYCYKPYFTRIGIYAVKVTSSTSIIFSV